MSIELSNTSSWEIALQLDSPSKNNEIYKETLGRFWLGRLVKGVHSVGDQKGRMLETALIIAGIIATGVFGASVYFSSEGFVLSFKEAYDAIQSGLPVPSIIGHAGEWSSQVIIYSFVFFLELKQVVREGDYNALKATYRKLIQNLSPETCLKTFYQNLKVNLKGIGPHCFLSKNIFQSQLDALRLMEELKQDTGNSELEEDRVLADILRNIEAKVKKNTGFRNYFSRLYKGLKSIKESHGGLVQLAASVTGLVLPVFLSFQSFLSFAGAGLVANEVINEEQESSVIGHIGEWPVNGITFAFMAKYFHSWAILSQGDLMFLREAIHTQLKEMAGDKERNYSLKTIQRLKDLSNEELDRRASKCMFGLLPSQYRL